MKHPDPLERHRTICGICDLVAVRDVRRTLSPSVYFGHCERCGKSTMQRDVGGPIEEPAPPVQPNPELLLAPTVGDGEPFLEGDPTVCPECGETGQHDKGCPFPSRLDQAYERWRQTDEAELIVASIRVRALELRAAGWTHYGVKALGEVARYDRALVVGPGRDGYRINNSYLSRLARDLMKEPELEGFFETRELRS